MNNKIDMSQFLIKDSDIENMNIDVTGEIVQRAVEEINKLNEKTIEQKLIVEQHKKLRNEIQEKLAIERKLIECAKTLREYSPEDAKKYLSS